MLENQQEEHQRFVFPTKKKKHKRREHRIDSVHKRKKISLGLTSCQGK